MAHKERGKKVGRGRIWPQHKVEAVVARAMGAFLLATLLALAPSYS